VQGDPLQLPRATFARDTTPAHPFRHYPDPNFDLPDGTQWVLEATAPDTIQLRRIAGAFDPDPHATTNKYVTFGITYPGDPSVPASCTAPGVPPVGGTGTATTMQQVFRFSYNAGDTLTARFCGEGSMMFINVFDESLQFSGTPPFVQFRCWRHAGNANACQRVF
jgi:hypothetical protein